MKGLVLLDENNKSELNNKVSDIQERLDEMDERLGMIAHNTAVWNRESRSIMVESINESLEKMFGRMAKQLFFCNLTESDLRSDSPVV